MKRILISGAGIAGLTLAYWMGNYGWEVVIVEKAPSMRTEGYMIDFFGNGWNVAQRMNILDKILSFRYPIDNFQFVDPKGNLYFSIPIYPFRKREMGILK